MGVNRFECRACPYEHVVAREYYERTEVKQKEVEDVFGGKEEFANADSVASEFASLYWFPDGRLFFVFVGSDCELDPTDFFFAAQCPAENCNGERAYFFQLQIRSADEPMTTFLKVGPPYMVQRGAFLTADAVYNMRRSLERELMWQRESNTTEDGFHAGVVSTFYSIMAHRDTVKALGDHSEGNLDTQNGKTSERSCVLCDQQNFGRAGPWDGSETWHSSRIPF